MVTKVKQVHQQWPSVRRPPNPKEVAMRAKKALASMTTALEGLQEQLALSRNPSLACRMEVARVLTEGEAALQKWVNDSVGAQLAQLEAGGIAAFRWRKLPNGSTVQRRRCYAAGGLECTRSSLAIAMGNSWRPRMGWGGG